METDTIIATLPDEVQRDLVALKLAMTEQECVFEAAITHLAGGTPTWPTGTDIERAFARTLALMLLEDFRRVAGHLELPALRQALAHAIRRSRAEGPSSTTA